MRVNGQHYRSIWYDAAKDSVCIIDQTLLPHHFEIKTLQTLEQVGEAIVNMRVRGAPLIGVTAAFGLYLAVRDQPQQRPQAINYLLGTRPTAVNLAWALKLMDAQLQLLPAADQARAALEFARQLAEQDVLDCASIGEHGSQLLEQLWENKTDKNAPLQILTHCNAGWLATVDWGTALAVIYKAQAKGIPLHVWVDETRPRNQGAALTTWELQQQGVPCTLIADNTGGHLMQRGMVDLCLVGSDRTTVTGDVCNKIGTYLKALAAHDNGIPFYVALPVSSIDFALQDGLAQIPIELRDGTEITHITGIDSDGTRRTVGIAPAGTQAANYAFDVTPARLVTALITEKGVCKADQDSILRLK